MLEQTSEILYEITPTFDSVLELNQAEITLKGAPIKNVKEYMKTTNTTNKSLELNAYELILIKTNTRNPVTKLMNEQDPSIISFLSGCSIISRTIRLPTPKPINGAKSELNAKAKFIIPKSPGPK